jgi:hypothetical protein
LLKALGKRFRKAESRYCKLEDDRSKAAYLTGVLEGYAKPRLLLASRSLSRVVQKAGDTPYQVIGNGFSER